MTFLNSCFLKAVLVSIGSVLLISAQTTTFTSTSMASYRPIVSPDSIAAGFGTNLSTTSMGTPGVPLAMTLGGAQVSITDSSGAKLAASLYAVFPTQINYYIPAGAALGKATVTVSSSTGTFTGPLLVSNISPAIVTANGNGQGVPAAQVLRVTTAFTTSITSPFVAGPNNTYLPTPINLAASPTDRVYLMLYGTGIRRHSLDPVKATIGGISVAVPYAGAQSQYPGLDQVNVGPFPASLVGKGTVNLVLTVDGTPANTVMIAFQ